MTRAVYEQLQETLFELKRVEEKKKKYKDENSAILSAISAMSGACNKTEVFNILLKVIERYVLFDQALVLTRHKYIEKAYRCLVSTSPIAANFLWQDGATFKRCVKGQTTILYAPDQLNEFALFNSADLSMCRSALISGMTINANESLLILFGAKKGAFDTKVKYTIERFHPLIERTILDIDYRERLQGLVEDKTRELTYSRQRFRDFAKTAGDWFWEINEAGSFTYLSSPSNEYLGTDPQSIQKQLNEQPSVKNKLQEYILRHKPFSEIELKITRHKRLYWISLSGRPFYDARGLCLGYRGTAKDITRRKKRLEELQQARKQAETANAAKSQFLAMMSHEIRTPLNAVMGLLYLFGESQLTNEQELWVKQMDKSTQLLLTIINDVLDLSKIESDHFTLEPENFNPRDSVIIVFNQLKELANRKQINLLFDIDHLVPPVIYHDENRFTQILLNLVGNAIKFTEKGTVMVKMRMHEERLCIEIADTGIGIDESKKADIFEPFTQADGSITRQFGGTGLGLAICRKLLAMMNGSIDFESELGVGTTFLIELPLTPIKKTNITLQNKKETRYMKPQRILVAEDSKANQMVIKLILEKAGHYVEVANNGQEAVDMIQQTPTQFDIVLMDMSMPVLCGIGATIALRKQNCMLPIIAITANAMHEDKEKCLNAGMNDFLTKPIRAHVLKELLEKHCLTY